MRRLSQSRRKTDLVDKFIDIGIAIESLLLHDYQSNDPISFPFRLRGAWMLGRNYEEREKYQGLFKELYNCRCAAVHKGKLTQKKKKVGLSLAELAKKGDSLCVELIKKILQTKKLPDWNRLILGDATETNST